MGSLIYCCPTASAITAAQVLGVANVLQTKGVSSAINAVVGAQPPAEAR